MADKVVRKKATRKVAKKSVSRKAPTKAAKASSERRTLLPFVAIGVFVLILGASIAVGYSDGGQIDVEDTINDKRLNGTEEEKARLQNIPVQRKRPSAPNGGLVPTTDPNPDPTPAPVEEETGTSTASSTDESTEGDEEAGDESDSETNEETTEETEAPAEEVAEETVEPEPEPGAIDDNLIES